ncbi:hypothetical protein BGZ92_004935 [Podila epicladia]|nr:hypothetical protein BGZ92_004935 [Podila epicladia]
MKTERAAKAKKTKTEKQEQAEAAARAVPPKEVAFGDRKLFMSFLNIVRDPIQRLSDSCSRVMVTMEKELASGLNVESDRIERVKRRNTARAAAIRNIETTGKSNSSKMPSRKGSMPSNDTSSEPAVAPTANPLQSTDRVYAPGDSWSHLKVKMGIKKPMLTPEEIEYAEALKAALGMSSVQYMLQELEQFDKAESAGLKEFVENHPALEAGPREEIFLIFFFLFALREIARELLRLGKYMEELEDREWKQMQEENRTKRKKQLWWPKVIGNFWRWISWGSFSQMKTSEGYTSAIMATTKNMEKSELRSVQQERERVEAKAKTARLAAELAARAAAKAATQKEKEHQRRRESLEKEHTVHQAIKEAETTEPLQRTLFINVPKPKSWRYRLWEGMQPLKSDEVKFGFKMAAALTFIGLWSWLDWDNGYLATDRGQWAMMTVMAVLSPTVGATFSVCAMRIIGTLIGSSWALLTYLAFPMNPYVILAMMTILAFTVAFLILESKHPLMGVIMMLSYSSVTFIRYLDNTNETIVHLFYKQAVTMIEGILIAVVVNSLLWPTLARRELRKEIAVLIGRQGALFAELINKFLLEHQVRDVDSIIDRESDSQSESQETSSRHGSRAPSANSTEILEVVETLPKGDGPRKAYNGQIHADQGGGDTSVSQFLQSENQSANDPDRLAFQYVEHQLQTKLIKISQLLELSASEPRLKEKFPMKLYKQIVQCCQNILDRMVSMRMAAQLLSPEVRDLVTGPMNYYRRDMVGALLLYFSVLSSSLASKTPLPPYLPSARVARLKVIYNVRIAIAEHQAVTSQNHYTYIYYYAFSSALEEVIEELELLAILIKPIVGITLITSGDAYAYGFQGNQINEQPDQYRLSQQTHQQQGPKTSGPGLREPSSSISEFSGANSGICASGPNLVPGTLPPPRIRTRQMTRDVHPDLILEHGRRQGGVISPTALQPQTGTTLTEPFPTPGDMASARSTEYLPELDPMQMPFSTATGSPSQKSKKLTMAVPVPVISPFPTTVPASPVIVMDESLLGNRHGQRFKDAILVAQEASGQQVIEVTTPVLQSAAAAVGHAPEMGIGSFQTGLSAGSPLITGN